MHDTAGFAYAGGVVQEEGLKKTLDEITGKVGAIALMATAFAQLQEYKEKLSALVEHLEPDGTSNA